MLTSQKKKKKKSDHKIWFVDRILKEKYFILNIMLKIRQGDYHHFHNIFRLFDVLPNFPYTTSETMRNYCL